MPVGVTKAINLVAGGAASVPALWTPHYVVQSDSTSGVLNTVLPGANGDWYEYSRSSSRNAYIAKFNEAGVQQWNKSPDQVEVGSPKPMIVDNVTGDCYVFTRNCLTKFDTDGATVWQKNVGNSSVSFPILELTPDRTELLVATSTTALSAPTGIIKMNASNGNNVWGRHLPAATAPYTSRTGLTVDSDGNIFLLCGSSWSSTSDPVLVKWNGSGILQWAKSYSTTNFNRYFRLRYLPLLDKLAVVGETEAAQFDGRASIHLLNPSDGTLFDSVAGDTDVGSDCFVDIAEDPLGDLYVLGNSYMVKFDSDLNEIKSLRFIGTSSMATNIQDLTYKDGMLSFIAISGVGGWRIARIANDLEPFNFGPNQLRGLDDYSDTFNSTPEAPTIATVSPSSTLINDVSSTTLTVSSPANYTSTTVYT